MEKKSSVFKIKVYDTVEIGANDVYENIWFDARSEKFPKDKPVLEVKTTGLGNRAILNNVVVQCNGQNIAISMVPERGKPVSFNRLDVRILGQCTTGILMDARAGGWLSANEINLKAIGCKRFIEMHAAGDSGAKLSVNEIKGIFQLSQKHKDETEYGIRVSGRENSVDIWCYDWTKNDAPKLILPKSAKRTHFVRKINHVRKEK